MVGLPCSYLPTQNRPYPPKFIAFLRIFFFFKFFTNSVNKPFFKIVKSCILIYVEFLKEKKTYQPKLKLMGRSMANKYFFKDGLRMVLFSSTMIILSLKLLAILLIILYQLTKCEAPSYNNFEISLLQIFDGQICKGQ